MYLIVTKEEFSKSLIGRSWRGFPETPKGAVYTISIDASKAPIDAPVDFWLKNFPDLIDGLVDKSKEAAMAYVFGQMDEGHELPELLYTLFNRQGGAVNNCYMPEYCLEAKENNSYSVKYRGFIYHSINFQCDKALLYEVLGENDALGGSSYLTVAIVNSFHLSSCLKFNYYEKPHDINIFYIPNFIIRANTDFDIFDIYSKEPECAAKALDFIKEFVEQRLKNSG